MKKNAIFFTENLKKTLKMMITTLTPHILENHTIDTWSQSHDHELQRQRRKNLQRY
jgi:hypothetical protein